MSTISHRSATLRFPKDRAALVSWGGDVLQRWGLLVAFVVTLAVFSALRPEIFPTIDNARSILEQAAVPGILAIGLTVPLLMNDFDLSIGATAGLGLAVAITVMTGGQPWVLGFVLALAIGAAVGFVNGFLVSVAGLHSFITTLAAASIIKGLEGQQTDQVTIFQGIPTGFTTFGQREIGSFRIDVWIAAVVALGLWLLLRHTEQGRHIAAIGGSSEAARLAGIPVKAYRTFGFVLAGVTAALAGVLLGAKSGSYYPNAGVGFLLPSFAAAFLGTTLSREREFSVVGTIVGVLYLGVIRTGLTQLNVETWIVNVVQGAVLIGALLMSRMPQR